MMCDHGDTIPVRVKVLAEQSHNGRNTWKTKPIDRCIAPIVEALQSGGIDMKGSCCGHGDRNGEILLGDGRKLKIVTGIDHEQEAMRAAASLLLDAGYPGETYKRLSAHIDGDQRDPVGRLGMSENLPVIPDDLRRNDGDDAKR